MNCVPAATATELVAAGLAATAEDEAPVPTLPVNPSATAAVSLGTASPKPHPPSLSWAITGPAHFPELKPQHESAQSASDVQTPVMNWVPAALMRRVTCKVSDM